MKKIICLLLLFVCAFSFAQTPTPNIGLQIPATGSNNWYIPLNYNFSKLDQLLSGNLPLPALSVTNDVHIGGNLYANQFIGPSGSSFATATGAAQYSPVYYCGSGTSSAFCGVAPFTGIARFQTNGIPRAATIADVLALWVGGGCTGTNYLRADGTCQSALSAGVTAINGTPGAFTFTGAGVSCTTTTCTFNGGGGGGGSVGTQGQLQAAGATAGSVQVATTQNVDAAIGISYGLSTFGDSIGSGTGASPYTNGWNFLLQPIVGGNFINQSVPGFVITQQAWGETARFSAPIGGGKDPVVVHEIGTNNAQYGADANQNSTFGRIYLGNLVWTSVPQANKINASSCTQTGFAAEGTIDPVYNQAMVSTTNGSTLSCTINAPNHVIYACYEIRNASGGTFTISVDGTPQTDPISGSTTWLAGPDGGVTMPTGSSPAVTQSPACARFAGLTNGNHTVLFTVTSATSGSNPVVPRYVAAAPTASTNNPYTIAVSLNQQNAQPGTPYVATLNTIIQGYVTNLAADGLNVQYADTNNALLNSPVCGNGNQATMFANCYADGVHPNNTGHSVMASTINALIPAANKPGVNMWRNTQPVKAYQYGLLPNPAMFAYNTNPNNLTTTGAGWVPGINFGCPNGQCQYIAPTPLGLTFNGGGGGLALCAQGQPQPGAVPSNLPTSSNCQVLVQTNGAVQVSGAFWIMTDNAVALASGTANAGTNVNSRFFGWSANAWRTDISQPAYYQHGFRAVPVSPTPAGDQPTIYLKLWDNSGIANHFAIDLTNANIPNLLGVATATTFNATTANITNLNVNGVAYAPIRGSSSAIGGSALVAGACSSTSPISVGAGVGATSLVDVSPQGGTPGPGFYWRGYVSSAGFITIDVCAAIAGTPASLSYAYFIIP